MLRQAITSIRIRIHRLYAFDIEIEDHFLQVFLVSYEKKNKHYYLNVSNPTYLEDGDVDVTSFT